MRKKIKVGDKVYCVYHYNNLKIEELDGFQDYINNHSIIFLSGGLMHSRRRKYLIFYLSIFINKNKKFYQLLKRLKKIKGVI